MDSMAKEREFEYSHGATRGLDHVDVLAAWVLAVLLVTSLFLSA